MMPSPLILANEDSLAEKAEALESCIEELLRQKSALEGIEDWNSRYDFADFIETVSLLKVQIELNREELQKVKEELAEAGSSSFSLYSVKSGSPAKVVHCKRDAFDVYIGRPSKWGNPFVIGRDGNRDAVIEKYRKWVLSQPDLLRDLPELRGKVLGCWCKPKACHGDVLVELLADL